MATVEQMYNGIYSPYDPSLPTIPAQIPAVPSPMSVQEMYRGIYGPTNPVAPASGGYQINPGALDAIGLFPSYGALAEMFAGSSRTRTEEAPPAPANGPGYQSGMVKQDNQRLLPGFSYGSNIGKSPIERIVPSIPFSNVPLPRPRPDNPGLASMYAQPSAPRPSAPPPSAPQPLRITVSGANSYAGKIAPTPAPASQRPQAPAPAYSKGGGMTAVEQLRSQGYSPADAYALANQQARDRAYESAHGSPDTRSDYFKSVTGG